MSQSSGRVLVVDDDPGIRTLIRYTLEAEGLAVDVATDGFEALNLAQLHAPDVVILDMSMPRMHGEEVARRLRDACRPDLPILVVSANNRLIEHAAKVGAFSHLEKPFELDHLVLAVKRGILNGRQAAGPSVNSEDVRPPRSSRDTGRASRPSRHQPR